MILAHLRARRFRNLEDLRLDLEPGVCVFYGDNAQGKTNILEAAYLLSNIQSFRTRRLRDLIKSTADQSLLDGSVEGRLGRLHLQVVLDLQGRSATVNGKRPESASAYLSEFHTVLFNPTDIELARGSQDLRRRYLDRATFLRDPRHLARLRDYKRVLRQRNTILRRRDEGIGVWEEKLAQLGADVYRARRETLEAIEPEIVKVHNQVSGRREDVSLQCAAAYAEGSSAKESLLAALRESRERDARLGYTAVGPHRDWIRVQLGGRPAERYGSQGQLRTLALSFKLAMLVFGRQVLGEAPVFLLDDPGSELDRKRLAFLAEFLDQWEGQVLVAGTDRDSIPFRDNRPVRGFRVEQGFVTEG